MNKKMCFILLLCLCLSTSAWIVYENKEAAEVLAEPAPIVSAEGAILINAENGRAIYEKNADRKLYPASTTKIMTALVGLEIAESVGADLSSSISVPYEAVGVEGSSLYLKKDECISLEELMYGMMLQSGNDAATAVAVCMSGSVEAFAKEMNERAKNFGCCNTHFVNPSGLFDENHYTTARDLAIIARQAMRNSSFKTIVGAESWSDDNSSRSFSNKNKTIHQYEGATGIKIGYTKASGRTLVASAKRGDIELIAVVLNAPDWFDDAYALLDYGFEREGAKS